MYIKAGKSFVTWHEADAGNQGIYMLHMIKEQNAVHGNTDLAFVLQRYDPIKTCL